MAAAAWQALQQRTVYGGADGGVSIGIVYERVDRCVGQQGPQRLEHLLAAAAPDEPVVCEHG